MKTLDPELIGSGKLHQFFLSSIAPRPIAFVSTVDVHGNPNLSPFSFFNAFGVNPSTLIFSPNRRNRDSSLKHTYLNIKAVPEAVINVVSYDIVHQVSLASTEYPDGVNEFIKAGLTALPSEKIRPFRVAESPVQFECHVREVIETGNGPGSGNLIVCEVVLVHVKEEILDESGMIIPDKARLVGRMGGDYYIKAFGQSLFKVAKPVTRKGIGIDALPDYIKNSPYLCGNHLGMLGNVEFLPTEQEITDSEANVLLEKLYEKNLPAAELQKALHLSAAELLEKEQVHQALCLLMAT